MVIIDNTQRLPYDKLLIASGARAKNINCSGSELKDIYNLRNLSDAELIKTKAREAEKIAILGGGLVSLKALEGLMNTGADISLYISSSQLMSRTLAEKPAGILQEHLLEKGVDINFNSTIKEFKGRDSVTGMTLTGGKEISCDLVVVGKGVRPEVEFLQDKVLIGNNGIRVDDYLKTSIPDIYAAGDVAEVYDPIIADYSNHALWINAVWEGRYAAWNMAGYRRSYAGSNALNSLNISELHIVTLGLKKARDHSQEQFDFYDHQKRIFKRVVLADNLLVGFTLIGDTSQAGVLRKLLQKKKPVDDYLRIMLTPEKMTRYII